MTGQGADGATLAELLAALAVGAVVVAAAVELHTAALHSAVTVERAERLAASAQLLAQILRSEIAPAGGAPCGAATPVLDWRSGATGRAAAGLPDAAGLGFDAGAGRLRLARFEPRLEAAGYRYTDWEVDEAGRVTLELAEAAETLPAAGRSLLVGDCAGLHAVTAAAGSAGAWLRLRAPAAAGVDPEELLPPTGAVWRRAALADPDDPRLERTTIGHSAAAAGVDEVGTLDIDGQPAVRGVAELRLGFAECGAEGRFIAPAAVTDWGEVCAVRAAVRLEGGARPGEGRLSWPLTVTVPLRGRLQ